MYRQITGCRICGNERLDLLLELGPQFLTGVSLAVPRRRSPSEEKARTLMRAVDLRPGDAIVDTGSNDGTLLSFFSGRAQR